MGMFRMCATHPYVCEVNPKKKKDVPAWHHPAAAAGKATAKPAPPVEPPPERLRARSPERPQEKAAPADDDDDMMDLWASRHDMPGGMLGLYRGILPGSISVFARNGAAMIVLSKVNKKIDEWGLRD